MQPLERDRLIAGATTLGLTLSGSQVELLIAYLALIGKWNRVYNLTAVRDPAEMLTHHLLDSLAAIAPLRTHLESQGRPIESQRLLDVGSGAGLPGVVIGALLPLQVTCVDTVGKKASFIRQAAAELGLRNVAAEHARVESLDVPPFDVITSRAFASLNDFIGLTDNLLASRGVWMAMKGKSPDTEIAALPGDVSVFHVEQLEVPGLNADRCLIWLRPSGVA